MAAQAKRPYITPQEYLERESKAEIKSEYHDGVIVAMAGASPDHNTITFNLAGELRAQLPRGRCRGFASDLRVHVPACNRYYYPDVTLICDEPQYEEFDGLRSLKNPALIIEVLSDSIEKTDRGTNSSAIRRLPLFPSISGVTHDYAAIAARRASATKSVS